MDKTTRDEFQKLADYMGANDIKAEKNNSERKSERDGDVIENENADFDLADMIEENANSIFDLAEYVAELKDRIEALEGGA